MQQTTGFSLQAHTGPYESWPLRSQLLIDGCVSGARIPGYSLLRQFEVPGGFLLVTDYDCPFEEVLSFVLLNKDMQVVSYRWLGASYVSFRLKDMQWINAGEFTVDVEGMSDRWKFRIRKWSIPYLWPKLAMSRLQTVSD